MNERTNGNKKKIWKEEKYKMKRKRSGKINKCADILKIVVRGNEMENM